MRFTPLHLRVLQLSWEGYEDSVIARAVGKTEVWVKNVYNLPQSKDILQRLENRVLDTTQQVQTVIQAAMPAIVNEQIQAALDPNLKPADRLKAGQFLLQIGGHVATRQVEIRRGDHVEEEYKNKTEDQIRREILGALSGEEPKTEVENPSDQTVH